MRKMFLLILIIVFALSGCVAFRLAEALKSRIISEVYISINYEVEKISPGNNEGLFVIPNINSKGDEVIFHGAVTGYSRIWKYNAIDQSLKALTDSNYVAVQPCFSFLLTRGSCQPVMPIIYRKAFSFLT